MTKVKDKVRKTVKTVFIITGILFAIFGFIIGYSVVKDLEQEELLKQEIINYSNKNIATDNFEITVKTKGDYAYVEEAIKKYFKTLSDTVKTVNSYLNSERVKNFLTVENLEKDSPDYSLSFNTIKDARINVNNGINEIKELCDEETIKNLLDKKKLDDPGYYYDFYIQLMYTDSDKKEFEKLNKDMDVLSQNINAFFDKGDEILKFLKDHSDEIEYKENKIYFSSETTLVEYKKHLSQLDEVASKITVEKEPEEDTNAI